MLVYKDTSKICSKNEKNNRDLTQESQVVFSIYSSLIITYFTLKQCLQTRVSPRETLRNSH